MPSPFVWFDNIGAERSATTAFLQNAFGWSSNDIGPMTFLTAEGEEKPFAATADATPQITGWVPYLEVDDLPAAVENARKHGAEIIAENLKGPAGDASFIRDPGGAPMALWKRAPGM
ncbi:VOC family protein [uncultured Litoreibacter sp.]|uniref:VOC family protein n=1 Tax=uncultured Litoreibacter sp. TaxID=1392394 RepID=UPI0026025138|nr:VOC family protein [uncultured Litoreibacter sp.]